MTDHIISTAEHYRLLIDGELLTLVQEAIALERDYVDSDEHHDRRERLQERLYDLYQEIGWSVVYDLKALPF